MQASEHINEAYQAIASLSVSGPAVKAVAKAMEALETAFPQVLALEKAAKEAEETAQAEEDDGK